MPTSSTISAAKTTTTPLSPTTSLEYHLRETEQLLEISLLKKKLRETERAMERIMADMGVGSGEKTAIATATRATTATEAGDPGPSTNAQVRFI